MRFKYALSFFPDGHEHLDAWSDVGFALAHLVLDHPRYAAHYRHRRYVFLDNSFHELGGKPLSIRELIEAVQIIRPQVVCAPDWIDDSTATVQAAVEMKAKLKEASLDGTGLAACVNGKDPDEMVRCWNTYTLDPDFASVYCLPYKCPRLDFLKQVQLSRNPIAQDASWHLLGMSNAAELLACGAELDRQEWYGATFDTSKPLNYAWEGIEFDPLKAESGKAHRPAFTLRRPLEEHTERSYISNVLKLKHALADRPINN